MRMLNRAYGYYGKVKNLFLFLGGLGVFIMMFYITADVLARNILSSSLVGTFEIVSNYVMPMTILPSLCLALSAGVMPRIVAVTDRLPHKAQRFFAIILPILEIVLYVIMLIASGKYAIQATQDKLSFVASTTSLPVWFMYYLPPLAYIMMTIESIFILLKNILTNSVTILFQDADPEEKNASI